jgi:hypothetical protein
LAELPAPFSGGPICSAPGANKRTRPQRHFGLGRLYRRTGTPEQAKVLLTTAAAMYGEMGMTYWLEKLEKDM